MIISYLCGGLGNQMFQYAVARRLARRHGVEVKLDTSAYSSGSDKHQSLTAFPRPMRIYELRIEASPASEQEIAPLRDKKDSKWPASHVRERGTAFEPRIMDLPSSAYLFGYWQSWKYFDEITPVIRADFQMKDSSIRKYAEDFVGRKRRPGRTLVSLHVRRGDRAHAVEIGRLDLTHVLPLELEYILAGIGRFDSQADFLVFSDTAQDIEWCRRNIKGPGLDAARLHFSEGHSDLQDMALMSACDHHIIAPSSFSWWAAWLNDRPGRRVIAPKQWTRPGYHTQFNTDELIPPDWELI